MLTQVVGRLGEESVSISTNAFQHQLSNQLRFQCRYNRRMENLVVSESTVRIGANDRRKQVGQLFGSIEERDEFFTNFLKNQITNTLLKTATYRLFGQLLFDCVLLTLSQFSFAFVLLGQLFSQLNFGYLIFEFVGLVLALHVVFVENGVGVSGNWG